MDIERELEEYRELTNQYATAKANRTYIEEFKKSKIALLMKRAERENFKSAAAQEREALAAEEYQQLLKGLESAVEKEERLKYEIRKIEMSIEVWRTLRADERTERRAYGA